MELKRLVFYVLAALFVIVLLLAMTIPGHGHNAALKNITCREELSNLSAALNAYRAEYQAYPTGKQPEIIRSLQGDNPKKIYFLSVNTNNLNPAGEYLDPWKTPYVLRFGSTNGYVISSAGKSGKFGDADDIVFNSLSNDFVKQ